MGLGSCWHGDVVKPWECSIHRAECELSLQKAEDRTRELFLGSLPPGEQQSLMAGVPCHLIPPLSLPAPAVSAQCHTQELSS